MRLRLEGDLRSKPTVGFGSVIGDRADVWRQYGSFQDSETNG